MRPTAGVTFGGRYELSSRIAIGGMGEVWQAADLVIGRTVAIKILKDEYMGDPGFLERFRAEARHAALVNHEGIANVYDYGEEQGSAFLVMELVPGEPLSAVLERDRMLSSDRVLDLVAQTANALHAAHAAGLVHRDIKPGNLLITPEGRVKITDFGIARIADQVPLTATGQVMGTVQYLSPEQASGHAATPSTDIYSLGIVAYEALAGRRPFTGESQVAIAMAQINDAPPELPATVAEPVRNLVYSSLAKKPEDRPATAAHLARAAQSLRRGDVAGAAVAVPGVVQLSGLPLSVAGSDAPTQVIGAAGFERTDTAPIQERRRSPWTWPLIALVALLLVVLVGTVIALTTSGQNPAPDDTTPPTKNTSSPPPTESETPEPTSETAAVIEAELIGLTQDEVAERLSALGMGLDPQEGRVAPTLGEQGLSYQVTPRGSNVLVGTTITVSFYAAIPTPPSPAAATLVEGPDLPTAGGDASITWSAYTACPANLPLTGYTFTVSNGGTLVGGNPVAAGTTSAVIQFAANAPSSVTVTYVANCGQLPSNASAPLTITVTPASTPESGEGTE